MTPRTVGVFLLLLATGGCGGVAEDSASAAARSLRQAGWRLVERAAHEELWASPAEGLAGGRLRVLGAGMNRWDAARGAWVPAEARFEPQTDGSFAARHTACRVRLASDLNSPAAVEVVMSDGQRLRSTPVGLAYRETARDRTVLLAEVRRAAPTAVGEAQVLYVDAFDGLPADVRYTVALDRFEQDVILRAAPPGPEQFGLDPAQTQLIVLTEFTEAPAVNPADGDAPGWQRLGASALAPGKAFQVGSRKRSTAASVADCDRSTEVPASAGVPVRKSWQTLAGRTFLIEAVDYAAVAAALAELPALPLDVTPLGGVAQVAEAGWVLPAPPRARGEAAPADDPQTPLNRSGWLLAGVPDSRPGFLVDYILITTPSITLAGHMTYLVTGPLSVENLVIEGGAVVKYAPSESARLTVIGTVTCRTGPYRPAFFTHQFDASVGEPVASGDPTDRFVGDPMLEVTGGAVTLEFLRFRHARTAVRFGGPAVPGTRQLRNVQLVRCETGVAVSGDLTNAPVTLEVGNLLAASVGTVLHGGQFRATAAHVSADRVNLLVNATPGAGVCSLALTNSVLVNVTNVSRGAVTVIGTHNGFWNSPTLGSAPQYLALKHPFQSVGAGWRYLAADASFRGAGTAAIDSGLLRDLRSWGATQPPAVWTNALDDEAVWAPVVARSQGNPDLGYHYEALDHAVTDLPIRHARLTLTNGVVVAAYGYCGLKPGVGAQVVSIGAPAALNVLTRYSTVQEQFGSAWDHVGATTLVYPPRGAAMPPPQMDCRFTRLTAPAHGGTLKGPGVGIYRFTDSQFAGGELALDTLSAGTTGMTLTLQNCLLEGVHSSFTDHDDPVWLTIRHCTFWHGQAWFRPGEAGAFQVRDTFFDGTAISATAGVDHDFNGYLAGSPRLMPPAPNDVAPLATPPAYDAGPLGDRYLPAVCELRDAGSRRDAAQAGLFHHTTSAVDRSREEHTRVDVGFHYVGWADGQPADTDGDTVADWQEDNNGNGALDSGETQFTSTDTDPDDGLNDRQTHELRFNVLVNDPRQDQGNEQNTQWQPKVVANGDHVVVAFWDSNQGLYALASGHDRGINRMVGWAVSRNGGVTFADPGQPPLASNPPAGPLPWPPNSPLPWGDAGDPVLARDRKANVLYFAGTSERRTEAFRGVPLWKSTDNGQTFVRCDTVRPDIEQSDYPWIAVDDWPLGQTGCFHDVYLVVRTLGPGTGNMRLYLLVAQDGNVSARNWTKQELAGYGATLQTVAVGPDHVAYVVWLQQSGQYPDHGWALQLRAVGSRGANPNVLGATPKTICELSTGPASTLALLRSDSGDASDSFKVFRHPDLVVNPTRPGHLYVAFTDRGSAADRADVFFTASTNGGRTWLDTPQRLNSLDGNAVSNDQWAPVLAVKPDGRQMLAAWLDRRNDPANSQMDLHGRWATIAGDGTVTWDHRTFRITTESSPPVYPGTLAANLAPGHYDPVWPPGGVTLEWWYDWWPLEWPPDEYQPTFDTYAAWMGEHNGACATDDYVYVVWPDGRRGSAGSLKNPQRRQLDIRLARVSWPDR